MKTYLQSVLFFLLVTQICFGQWVQTNFPQAAATCLAVNGPYLYAGTYNEYIFCSPDNGDNWTLLDSGLICPHIQAITFSGENVIAGAAGEPCRDGWAICLSTDNGTSWNVVFPGFCRCLINNDNYVFAGIEGYGIYRSSDNGLTWSPVNTGLTDSTFRAFAVSGIKIFAGSNEAGIFVTTNNGTNWTAVNTGLSNLSIYDLAVSGTYIFANTGDGIFCSSDDGANWSSVNSGLPSGSIATDFAVINANIFVSIVYGFNQTYNSTVYLSTDYGESWTDVGSGLPVISDWISSLTIKDNNIFAGDYQHLWRRPLSQMVTDVKNNRDNLALSLSLLQNYPNPFNPNTTIKYSIPQTSQIQIKVFDILGNEIEILVNEENPAGNYQLIWNAENLPSGVYFCQLKAGLFFETKKMVLLR